MRNICNKAKYPLRWIAYGTNCVLEILSIVVDHHYRGALLPKECARRFTDAAATTSHYRNLAIKPTRHVRPPNQGFCYARLRENKALSLSHWDEASPLAFRRRPRLPANPKHLGILRIRRSGRVPNGRYMDEFS